jgi:hypothetical protein
MKWNEMQCKISVVTDSPQIQILEEKWNAMQCYLSVIYIE